MLLSEKEYIYLILIIVVSSSALLILFISVIFINIRQRKQKEIEKLNAIIETQESERLRISADMHDEIGPLLSAIKLQINAFGYATSKDNLAESISSVSNQLDLAISNIRVIVRDLAFKKPGLLTYIEGFKNIVEAEGRMSFTLNHSNLKMEMTENAEANIYRIVSELINNSIKHSTGSQIILNINEDDRNLYIEYADNGTSNELTKNNIGMGLKNIQNRVSSLNGNIVSCKDFSHGAKYKLSFDKKHLH